MSERNVRYERKFVIENLSKQSVISVVKTNPAIFSEIYHQRYINNIYLDTHNLMFYLDNNFGKANRKKVRVRWYGDLLGRNQKPRLEYKLKTGAVGDKLVYNLVPFDVKPGFSYDQLQQVFEKSQLPEWVLDDLRSLKPTLLNRYSREYFLSFDRNYRITIDQQLEYCKICPQNNSFIQDYKDYKNIILELKYKVNGILEPDFVSNHLPFRLTKSSKYVNGIEKFYWNIPV